MINRRIWDKFGYAYMIVFTSSTAIASAVNYYSALNVHWFTVILHGLVLSVLSMVICRFWKQAVAILLMLSILALMCFCVFILIINQQSDDTPPAEDDNMSHAAVISAKAVRFLLSPRIRLLVIILAVGISLYMLQKHYIGRMITAAAIFIWLVAGSLLYWKVTKTAALMGTIYMFMVLAETLLCHLSPKSDAVNHAAVSWLMPVFLLTMLLLWIMPVRDTPLRWTWVRQGWQMALDAGESLRAGIYAWLNPDSLDFDINFSGFSNESFLTGNLNHSNDRALRLEILSDRPGSIYLAGTVKNIYTHKGWDNTLSLSQDYDEHYLDLAEFMYAMMRSGKLTEDDGIAALRSLRVTYDGLYVKNMFLPGKVGIIRSQNNWQYEPGSFTPSFLKLPRRGATYSVNYMEPNYASPYMNELLISQEGYQYNEKSSDILDNEFFYGIADQYPSLNMPKIHNLEQVLKERSADIRRNYTSIPEKLPHRVTDLAAEVTSTAKSDYEKMKAIEVYLSTYQYSVSPGLPPPEADVVDYFLFESKTGYCTYFASALAVLGRAAGMPTRYVQGFVTQVPESGRTIVITDSNAHAWAEAYIQGVGWIPFEASTGFSQYLYHPWTSANDIATQATQAAKYAISTRRPNIAEMEENHGYISQLPSDEEETQAEEKSPDSTFYYVLLCTVLLLCIASAIFLVMRVRVRIRTYRRANFKQRIFMDMEALFAIWASEGKPIEAGETYLGYMERLARSYPVERRSFDEAAPVYMDVRYGDKEAEESQWLITESLRKGWVKRMIRHREWGRLVNALIKIYLSKRTM